MAGKCPSTREAVTEAVEALRKLLDAVDAGELDAVTPGEVALLRRLQGTLVGWEETLRVCRPTDHAP
jgi:hypothetical protein